MTAYADAQKGKGYMMFWELHIKYTKIAVPDVILFSDKATAEYYKLQKERQENVAWVTIKDLLREIPIQFT